MPELDLSELQAGLAELRDVVNTSRVVSKGLQSQARTAVRLAFDLDERLGRFDSQLQQLQRLITQRQATEAQRDDHSSHEDHAEPQAGSRLARAV